MFGRRRSTESTRELGKTVSKDSLVVGTTQLFEAGQIRCVPMPTPDPRDPLNLPEWRKWCAVAALCFFGALSLAAEAIIGALVPVFVLEYAGIDPRILGQLDFATLFPKGVVDLSPLGALASLGGPPLWKTALISSLPLLVNGVASFVLVPLSIAVGRRPVLLAAAALAWAGGLWAGFSHSLDSHLAARCFQGLGAGAVEALIPLIIQDIMFIHKRNKAIASIGASQGILIVGLGIASPIIVVKYSWRYIYWITSGVGILAWIALILLVPESRWIRTADELAGKEVYEIRPGENRPRLDPEAYGPRTRWIEFGMFHYGLEWREAVVSVWHTVKTTAFPNVLWVIVVNATMVSIYGSATQVGSSVLIAAGFNFEDLGFAVVPLVVASPFVWLFGGYVADKVSNYHARRNGGRREPEAHLLSLVLPLAAAVAGTVVFGYVGQNVAHLPGVVLLVAVFLIGFGMLTAQTIFSVYLIESYPRYAGPVLVNVASLRLIVGFITSFDATSWIQDVGFLTNFAIYGGVLGGFSLLLPIFYFFGKRIRAWTAGRLEPRQDDKPPGEFDDDPDWKATIDEPIPVWMKEKVRESKLGVAI